MFIVETTHKTADRYSETKLVTVLVLDDNKRGKKLQKQKIKQKMEQHIFVHDFLNEALRKFK